MIETLVAIGAGTVSGIMTAALGYAKTVGKAEKFDDRKFLQTCIVGGIVGGIGGEMGMSYTEAYAWASTVGLVTIIEYIKKTIIRLLRKR